MHGYNIEKRKLPLHEPKILDYWVKDIEMAEQGKNELEIAFLQMPAVQFLVDRYRESRPLAGLRITGCVTLTKETGILVRALRSMGAEVRWCSDNRFSINDAISAALASEGIPVFGVRGETEKEYFTCMKRALEFRDGNGHFLSPHQILDDGCDITRFIISYMPHVLRSVRGITEQTTCGVNEVRKLIAKGLLRVPVINVNDCFVKNHFDNYYGVRESVIAGLQNAMNHQVAGSVVAIYGYGQVGTGCARAMRYLGGCVLIVETDVLRALYARMDGFEVVSHEDALRRAHIVMTATGCIDVITPEDMNKMRKGAILCNVGHGDREYNINGLKELVGIKEHKLSSLVSRFTFPNGHFVLSLCDGALLNMIAAGGNPPSVMSMTFATHILAHIDLAKRPEHYSCSGLYELSQEMNIEVANAAFPDLASKVYELTPHQSAYLGRVK